MFTFRFLIEANFYYRTYNSHLIKHLLSYYIVNKYLYCKKTTYKSCLLKF